MPLAVIDLAFDPTLRLGQLGVRWETLGIGGAILLALVVAAVVAGRTPESGGATPSWAHGHRQRLRRDDLLFIVLGALPGAVIGGRLGYVLIHLDFYSANTGSILDPGQGSLELSVGLLGGVLSGAYVARLLDAPVGRWLHVATVPLFLAIAAAELARVLGGSGQGAPSDLPWSTAYPGLGPWGSLAPAIPAHPAQVYEAIVALVAVAVVALVIAIGGFRARDGSAFFVALAIWAVGRAIVSASWRDEPLIGPLPAGGIVAIGVALVATITVGAIAILGRHGPTERTDDPAAPLWPDAQTRPRF